MLWDYTSGGFGQDNQKKKHTLKGQWMKYCELKGFQEAQLFFPPITVIVVLFFPPVSSSREAIGKQLNRHLAIC